MCRGILHMLLQFTLISWTASCLDRRDYFFASSILYKMFEIIDKMHFYKKGKSNLPQLCETQKRSNCMLWKEPCKIELSIFFYSFLVVFANRNQSSVGSHSVWWLVVFITEENREILKVKFMQLNLDCKNVWLAKECPWM